MIVLHRVSRQNPDIGPAAAGSCNLENPRGTQPDPFLSALFL